MEARAILMFCYDCPRRSSRICCYLITLVSYLDLTTLRKVLLYEFTPTIQTDTGSFWHEEPIFNIRPVVDCMAFKHRSYGEELGSLHLIVVP